MNIPGVTYFPHNLAALVLAAIAVCWGVARGEPESFSHVTTLDGLSQSSVQCILRDSKGYLWLGTEDGLNKYDGVNFTVYRHQLFDSTSLSANGILSLLEGRDGRLWIGTNKGGLCCFNRQDGTFCIHRPQKGDTTRLSGDEVLSLAEDKDGTIWVGTGNGLNRLNPATGRVQRYSQYTAVRCLLIDRNANLWVGTQFSGLWRSSSERTGFNMISTTPVLADAVPIDVRALCEDTEGRIWAGTYDGRLLYCMPGTKDLIHANYWGGGGDQGCGASIRSIDGGVASVLWVATEGKGLYRVDTYTGAVVNHLANPNQQQSLSQDNTISVLWDPDSILWVGTQSKGLNFWDAKPSYFRSTLGYEISDPDKSVGLAPVYSFLEDSRGRIWIGTNGQGVRVIDRGLASSKVMLEGQIITDLLEDTHGRVWAGSYQSGLTVFNPNSYDTQTIWLSKKTGDPKADAIRALEQDGADGVWIGTSGGLFHRTDDHAPLIRFQTDPKDSNSLCYNVVTALYRDRRGMLWIGTTKGLDLFDSRTPKFQHYRSVPRDPRTLSDNDIRFLTEASDNTIWIGTAAGLNRLDANREKVTRIADGDLGGAINGIVIDSRGLLWVTTNRGIFRFDPTGRSNTLQFSVRDGLQSNEFNQGAILQTRSGDILAGGVNGYNVCRPELAIPRRRIVIERLSDVFNRRVFCREPSPDTTISLSFAQRSLSIDFTSLSLGRSQATNYTYRLAGLDQSWVQSGTQTRASFINLSPGQYTFRVRDSAGDSTSETRLNLVISPPWWSAWWFIVLTCVIVIAGLLVGGTRYINRRNDEVRQQERALKEAELQELAQQERAKKEAELLDLGRKALLREWAVFHHSQLGFNNLKDLQANVHDLSDIMGSIDGDNAGRRQELLRSTSDCIDQYNKFTAGKLRAAVRTTYALQLIDDRTFFTTESRLYNLSDCLQGLNYESLQSAAEFPNHEAICKYVAELLNDASKIRLRLRKLYVCDIVDICRKVLQARAAYLDSAGIQRRLDVHMDEPVHGVLDSEVLIDVLDNLIANAIDAMAGSSTKILQITVQPAARPDKVYIKVIDTGCGVPKNNHERIFFGYSTKKDGGGGFGLSDAKNVLLSYGCNIWLDLPQPDIGTSMVIGIGQISMEGEDDAKA